MGKHIPFERCFSEKSTHLSANIVTRSPSLTWRESVGEAEGACATKNHRHGAGVGKYGCEGCHLRLYDSRQLIHHHRAAGEHPGAFANDKHARFGAYKTNAGNTSQEGGAKA